MDKVTNPPTMQQINLFWLVYSSKEIPFRIIISKNNQRLVAQPIGYSSYTLESIGSGKFKCGSAQVIIEFNSRKNKFKLNQGSMYYHFIKEN